MSTYDALLDLEKSKHSPTPKTSKEKREKTPITSKPTQKSTPSRILSSDKSRKKSRGNSTPPSSEYPTRDEIQEFSFRLRDELKVKVQAEVPHEWQGELEEVSRTLNVKKLELYRYIFGEFLGKVKRKQST